jgi:hypothetical protein
MASFSCWASRLKYHQAAAFICIRSVASLRPRLFAGPGLHRRDRCKVAGIRMAAGTGRRACRMEPCRHALAMANCAVRQSYPACATTGSGGVLVFKNRILGSAYELVLGVKTRSQSRRGFSAGAFLLDLLAGYPVLPIQRNIRSRRIRSLPMDDYTVRDECDERTGEYRHNKAREDRDPLHSYES